MAVITLLPGIQVKFMRACRGGTVRRCVECVYRECHFQLLCSDPGNGVMISGGATDGTVKYHYQSAVGSLGAVVSVFDSPVVRSPDSQASRSSRGKSCPVLTNAPTTA